MLFYVLLVFFLLANIIVAYRAARHSTGTIQDFIATKKLSTATLVMTLFATLMDGSVIGITGGSGVGILSFFYPVCFGFTTWLLGRFVFPKLAHSKKHTLADLIGSKYGREASFLTLLLSTSFSLFIIVAQLRAIAHVGTIVNIPPYWLIIIVGLLVTTYTSFGGIRAVAMTDVLQCFIMIGGLVFLSLFVIYNQGGFSSIIETLANKNDARVYFQNQIKWKNGGIAPSLFFWSIFPIIIVSPPVIQRILMAANKRKVKNMCASFGILYPCLRFFTLFLGLTIAIQFEELSKDRSLHVGYLVKAVCSNTMVQLCFVFALLAVVMSTIDSFLHALVSMWMYDFFLPISKNKKNFLRQARWLSCIIGLIAVCAALFFDKAKKSDVIEYGYMPFSALTIPFLFGVLGLKSNAKAFWITIISYAIVFPVSYLLIEEGTLSIVMDWLGLVRPKESRGITHDSNLMFRASWFCSLFVSMLVFFFVVYHQAGGFIFLKQTKEGFEKQSKSRFNLHFFRKSCRMGYQKS